MPAASAAVGGTRRFVDISVPRNISASVNELEGAARVFNVDDLKEVWHSITAICWLALGHVSAGLILFWFARELFSLFRFERVVHV